MGEAKRRGTFDVRKALAVERDEAARLERDKQHKLVMEALERQAARTRKKNEEDKLVISGDSYVITGDSDTLNAIAKVENSASEAIDTDKRLSKTRGAKRKAETA